MHVCWDYVDPVASHKQPPYDEGQSNGKLMTPADGWDNHVRNGKKIVIKDVRRDVSQDEVHVEAGNTEIWIGESPRYPLSG